MSTSNAFAGYGLFVATFLLPILGSAQMQYGGVPVSSGPATACKATSSEPVDVQKERTCVPAEGLVSAQSEVNASADAEFAGKLGVHKSMCAARGCVQSLTMATSSVALSQGACETGGAASTRVFYVGPFDLTGYGEASTEGGAKALGLEGILKSAREKAVCASGGIASILDIQTGPVSYSTNPHYNGWVARAFADGVFIEYRCDSYRSYDYKKKHHTTAACVPALACGSGEESCTADD